MKKKRIRKGQKMRAHRVTKRKTKRINCQSVIFIIMIPLGYKPSEPLNINLPRLIKIKQLWNVVLLFKFQVCLLSTQLIKERVHKGLEGSKTF